MFVLIHSPLVGPYTWALVAEELKRRGSKVVVPDLHTETTEQGSYWKRHAQVIRDAIQDSTAHEPLTLVAHSGAGPLLPAVRSMLDRPVAAYAFVDAGWPADGKSRFDLFGDKEAVERFQRGAVDGALAVWTDDDLRESIPNDQVRHRFVSELRPTPLAVYAEPLPVFAGWPDVRGAYLQFSQSYDTSGAAARAAGWPYKRLVASHFHVLVEPALVADEIRTLVASG